MHTSWELVERKSGMSRISSVKILRVLLFYVVVANCHLVSAQVSTPEGDGDNAAANSQNVSELLEKLDRLVEQNGQPEKQNRELMDQIQVLRGVLTQRPGVPTKAVEKETISAAISPAKIQQKEREATANLSPAQEEPYKWGRY